jgi:hypothetical protein
MLEVTTQSHYYCTILNLEYSGLKRLLTIVFAEKNEKAKTTFISARLAF